MGDHYLPQHYLKAFAENGRFWVHDLIECRTRRGQPKSEANINGLWPAELESHLANKIEAPAQDTIDRIRGMKTIGESEKKNLASYLLAMWKRVPAAKGRTAAHIPKLAIEYEKAYLAQVDAYACDGSITAEQAVAAKQTISKTLTDIAEGSPDYYWHHQIREGASPRMFAALLTMHWTFMVSTTDPFLTCDDPLFFFPEAGVGRKNSELSIPLSTSITLLAHRQSPTRSQFRDIRQKTVAQLNRRTAFNAKRYLFSEQNIPWALKLGTHKPRPTPIIVNRA
ncbi:hypothetical protein B9Y60_01380 [Stenotrophomonas maltophilia]|uniref:DUF4238 domain-containing protein n=1 Tax=Stenotrophomonas maltophilia TaxID=40324 RepID=UPI000C260A04|nr:DUF4238 domain-containing protein [Stenotrophomonas maltophilia]PJL57001.1 hypothetical protein B9Y73_01380 [Stenotrophomonas maltophilia]PJL62318.1 hypothetical protein B9Y60_01380 [Stenotrophomonas maltophilia]